MTVVLGAGQFRFEVIADWAKVPPGMRLGDVGGVGVDQADNVYVFNRGPHPMIIFDREGEYLRSWGEGVFQRPHGVDMGPEDTIYLTDDGDHTIRCCTLEGRLLFTIGIPGHPSEFMSGRPFNRCTHTALSPQGEIYVADGYGNARVHKFSPDGKLMFSWGESGSGPGEFNLVHNICCDGDGWVYVADRENHRVQVFDSRGKYEAQWNNLHRPCGLHMKRRSGPICYIAELGPAYESNRNVVNLGPRISIADHTGTILARLGCLPAGEEIGQFVAPHGIAVDSRGDIYVGEVSNTYWPFVRPAVKPVNQLRTLQKLVRLS